MSTEHPITPPLELVEQLRNDAPHGIRDAGVTRERHLVIAAYRAGADAELEACCEWLSGPCPSYGRELRAAMRPKPPSLAEEALAAWTSPRNEVSNHDDFGLILRALERLQELESNG